MTLFDYALLRYVGDPVRGEALNVGVVVVGPDGDVLVQADPAARTRLRSIWPDFNAAAYRDVIRQLRQALGVARQLEFLEVQPLVARRKVSAEDLRSLASAMPNALQLSPPARVQARSLHDAVTFTYERFVRPPMAAPLRRRHMTRHELRNMIQSIFTTWAQGRRGEVIVEADAEVVGLKAPHHADLVAYRGNQPEYVFFALPVSGTGAYFSSLVRDSLPVIVEDVGAITPGTKFYAVLPDAHHAEANRLRTADLVKSYREFLRGVPGLTVAQLSELRDEFGIEPALVG